MAKDDGDHKDRLVLLDAHAILHRAYHALPDFTTAKGEPTGALYGLSAMLMKIVEDLKPDYIVACYDVKGPTYRHEAYKNYKAQRKAADDDLVVQMKRSRDIFAAFNIPIYEKQGFEADDILGTIVEKVRLSHMEQEVVIASGDMDTMQLITGNDVKVYTLKKGINDTVIYNEDAVRERFGFGPELVADYKGLRGDPSDNIIGVPGIGEKTATILITTFGGIENIYKELELGHDEKFKKAGITPRIIQILRDNKEEADFSKMLATIKRDVPIDFHLPDRKFRDSLDIGKIDALWRELEFRTLTQRLEKLIGSHGDFGLGQNGDTGRTNVNGDGRVMSQSIVADDLEKTSLALWLVNSNITNPGIDDVLGFANTDDYSVAKKAIFEELTDKNLEKVYEEIELPLIPVIRSMEKRGVKVDRQVLLDLSKDYHVTLRGLEEKIHDLAGSEFNINSPKQLGEILFDKLGLVGKNMKKTGSGARSTRESELEKLKDLHPIVPLIFEYRELQKLLSTYIDAIPPLLDENDRLHTDFISSGTTTGRMASQNPNLQNIPIKSDLGRAVREAFVAEKSFVLAGFDYSQMELRIAAFLSGDEKLISIFKEGRDIHTSVASSVFGVPEDKVTADMRRQAKVINFGIIYGMGVLALKQNLGTTRDQAQKFLDDYFSTFSTLASYLDRVKLEASRNGYTETLFGRRRYFDGIKSKIPYVKAQAERMAINAPIQGTEADIIKLAMVKVSRYLAENRLNDSIFPLLQVHDELIYEIKEDMAESVVSEIERIMESVVDVKTTKGIVMRASASVGKNWGELS